jgi:hypothetical protein
MKRYVIGAIAGPAVLWLGFVVLGRKRMDEAGNLLVKGTWPGGIPAPSGPTLMAAAAGVLAAYLTK